MYISLWCDSPIPQYVRIEFKIYEWFTTNLKLCSPSSGNESMEPYLNDLIGMFYALNENAWRRFAFEVCRELLVFHANLVT